MDPQIPVSIVLLFSLLALSSAAPFSPLDNHLIDCGSISRSTRLRDRRVFRPDSDPKLLSTHALTSSVDRIANPNPLYRTARIFTSPSSYRFPIRQRGPHLLRLHFYPFSSPYLNLSSAFFHVFAAGRVLLSNFAVKSSSSSSPLLKEFLIPVDAETLVLSFVPAKPSFFAFVNAIELISAPADLLSNKPKLVGPQPDETFLPLSRQAMETIYRINVGGRKITPFNDTLWRTWLPDSSFVVPTSPSRTVAFSGRINYRGGGASKEIGPDNLYNSARVSSSNMTWAFPVDAGYRYLLRLHFCDIASFALNELYLNVYVNGFAAYQDLDLSDSAGQVLALPYYVDLVTEVVGDSAMLNVVVGPSNLSDPRVGALLNGLEIMKINNTVGSLDGVLPEVLVLERSKIMVLGGGQVLFRSLVCGVVFAALVGMGFVLVARWKTETRELVVWSPLPVDASDDMLMKGTPAMPGKFIDF